MAQMLNNIFGGAKSSATPVPSADSDFADFAGVPDVSADPMAAASSGASIASAVPTTTAVPYTKWYNVHERHSIKEFRSEGIIIGLMVIVLVIHVIGAYLNRTKARAWMKAHAGLLASEFALVGFGKLPPTMVGSQGEAATAALAALAALGAHNAGADPKTLLKESSLFEYATYATGRQNVAFVDFKLKLIKRFNPFVIIAESIVSFFFDSMPMPSDTLEAVLYPFDGKEALTVPGYAAAAEGGKNNAAKSTFDSFVWAIVHKERMKGVRDERFDVSLTFTKDSPKLPPWLTIMSESAEITEALLTPELIKAAEAAGDALDYLIITDQPIIKPTTLDETNPRKRVYLKYRLPSGSNYDSLLPILTYFVRSADVLVQTARLRPEVLRKVKNTRDETVRLIKKADEEEKAEERAAEREKARKLKRDTELNALDAKAQKKYLEREKEKEMRRASKRTTMRA